MQTLVYKSIQVLDKQIEEYSLHPPFISLNTLPLLP